MVAYDIYYSDNSILVYYAHLRLNSVKTPFLYGYIIVGVVD